MSKHKMKFQSILLYVILIFYVILLLSILIFRGSPLELFNANREIYRRVNILPFQSIIGYLFGITNVSSSVALNNVLGNIVLFIPLGIYLQLLKRDKRVLGGMFFILLVSLSAEITQFALGIGATDIDDIILNCLGGIIGVFCYKTFITICKRR